MHHKTKKLGVLLLSAVLIVSAFVLPKEQASAASTQMKVINTNSLNVRTGPGTKYKVTQVLKKNTVVTRTSVKGNWAKIKVGKKTGFVNKKYLKKYIKTVSNKNANVGKYYSITAAKLNVRKTSSASSKKLATVVFGNQFIIKGQAANGWFKIEYRKGVTGYVSNKYGIISKSKANAYPKGTIFGPLSGRTFVIDPGHGGSQNGAYYYGVKEKDINLKASLILRKELQKAGAKVVMTRATDKTLTLQQRVAVSKSVKPDAFISVHHNVYNKKSEKGYLALYSKKSEKTLTRYIFNGLKKPVSSMSSIPAEEYRYQSLHVLRENPTIGTLMEYGYMNRKSELKTINTDAYRTAVAKGITTGLTNYFKVY